MIDVNEIRRGIYGGYRLCRLDSHGLAYMNATEAGFWRSFLSAVLIAPVYFVTVFLDLDLSTVDAGVPRILLLESCAYVVLVFAYPLAMHYLSEWMGRQQQYFLYIVAYNWASVTLAALELPVDILSASGLLPGELGGTLEIAVRVVIFVILWFIARAGLGIQPLVAVGLVALDFAITLAVDTVVDLRLGIA